MEEKGMEEKGCWNCKYTHECADSPHCCHCVHIALDNWKKRTEDDEE